MLTHSCRRASLRSNFFEWGAVQCGPIAALNFVTEAARLPRYGTVFEKGLNLISSGDHLECWDVQ